MKNTSFVLTTTVALFLVTMMTISTTCASAKMVISATDFERLVAPPKTMLEGAPKAKTIADTDLVVGLFCADDGKFSGLGELHYLKQKANIIRNVTIKNCLSAEFGLYPLPHNNNFSIKVLFVTTGINAVNAAACTASAINDPMSLNGEYQFWKILWSGTSGWSPMIGGMNPTQSQSGGCSPLTSSASVKKLAVGSVCVTASSVDMSCGMKVSLPDMPRTLCRRPNAHMQNATQMFGNCNFDGNKTFAETVYRQAKQIPFPAMPTELQSLMSSWWGSNKYLTPEEQLPAPVVPTVLAPDECVEQGINEIWVGQDKDYLCREYTADILRTSPGVKGKRTPDNVACVSAMEGPGFLRVMTQQTAIPFVVVRAASNYDQYPPYPVNSGSSDPSAPPSWHQNTTYVSEDVNTKTHVLGYRYAILTSNLVLSNYLESLNN